VILKKGHNASIQIQQMQSTLQQAVAGGAPPHQLAAMNGELQRVQAIFNTWRGIFEYVQSLLKGKLPSLFAGYDYPHLIAPIRWPMIRWKDEWLIEWHRLYHDEVTAAVAEIKADEARKAAARASASSAVASSTTSEQKGDVRVVSVHDEEPAQPRLALVYSARLLDVSLLIPCDHCNVMMSMHYAMQ
jgi:hypothetical protein